MIWTAIITGLVVLSIVSVVALLTMTGQLTLDLELGRRTRPLGPQVVRIGAQRTHVFDLLTVPYLSARPPRELREKVQVLDRGNGMVLAAHRTQSRGFTTVTLETVTFEPPDRIGFFLVRGPVPYVRKSFVLRELDDGATELRYEGELGADGWALGAWWARIVAVRWEATVAESLASLTTSAEALAARRRDRSRT